MDLAANIQPVIARTEVCWGELPLELLSIIASGKEDSKGMRGVCRSWKTGFDESVTRISKMDMDDGGPFPQMLSGALTPRFPKLAALQLPKHGHLQALRALAGARVSEISLSGCSRVTKRDVAELRGFPATALDLSHTGVSDSGIAALRGMPLKRLNMERCKQVGAAGLAAALQGMPLTHLSLKHCNMNRLRPPVVSALRGMPLTHLDLGWGVIMNDAALEELAAMPLTHLDIGYGVFVTDAGLRALMGMPLMHLNLEFCEKITPAGIALLKGLPLTLLSMRHCSRIPRGDLESLQELLPAARLLR